MTCLDRYFYQDPMRALMQKQEREINRKAGMVRVCAGCVHKRTIESKGEMTQACALKRGSPSLWCSFKKIETDE